MKPWWIVLLMCLMAAGCDYSVPLATTPELDADAQLVGVWAQTNEQKNVQQLLVLPLDKRELMIAFPAGSADSMYARVVFLRRADMNLAQLEWIGSGKGRADTRQVFQFAACEVKADALTVRLLNPDVVSNTVTSARQLVRLIKANRSNPALFRDAMNFHRVPAP